MIMADIRDDNNQQGTMIQELFTSFNNVRKLMGKLHNNRTLYPGEFMMLGAINHGVCKHEGQDVKNEDIRKEGEPGIRVSELCKMVHSTKSATSKMLKGLEEKNYIERITDTRDRRVVYIILTETGKNIIQDSTRQLHEFTDKTVKKMGEDDTKTLILMLGRLYEAMNQVIKESREDEVS